MSGSTPGHQLSCTKYEYILFKGVMFLPRKILSKVLQSLAPKHSELKLKVAPNFEPILDKNANHIPLCKTYTFFYSVEEIL